MKINIQIYVYTYIIYNLFPTGFLAVHLFYSIYEVFSGFIPFLIPWAASTGSSPKACQLRLPISGAWSSLGRMGDQMERAAAGQREGASDAIPVLSDCRGKEKWAQANRRVRT